MAVDNIVKSSWKIIDLKYFVWDGKGKIIID